MRIKITAGGIYDGKGKELEIGSEHDLKDEPIGWAGRYTVVSGGKKEGKTAVTNGVPVLKAEHHGGGKFNITKGEEVLLSGISKAEADDFNALSDEDKAAFVAEQAKA